MNYLPYFSAQRDSSMHPPTRANYAWASLRRSRVYFNWRSLAELHGILSIKINIGWVDKNSTRKPICAAIKATARVPGWGDIPSKLDIGG